MRGGRWISILDDTSVLPVQSCTNECIGLNSCIVHNDAQYRSDYFRPATYLGLGFFIIFAVIKTIKNQPEELRMY